MNFLAIQKELFKRPDIHDLVKEVRSIINFIMDYDFDGELKYVQDTEIPDWEEIVLTMYVRAPVEEILELWDKLYDHVNIKKIVVEIKPRTRLAEASGLEGGEMNGNP